MKNLTYFSAILFAFSLIYSCTPCADCPDGQDQMNTLTLTDTISENKYQTWVTNWKTNGQDYTANTLTDYFTMPLVDITEFQQYPGTGRDSVVAARFVIGMELAAPDSIIHLMLVGVNGLGQSMTDASKQQYVYDVTMPCPTSCGANSLPK